MANGNEDKDMARLVVAQKTGNGKYRYKEKMVPVDRVDEEIDQIKSSSQEEK